MGQNYIIHECINTPNRLTVKKYDLFKKWCLETQSMGIILMPIEYCPFCGYHLTTIEEGE